MSLLDFVVGTVNRGWVRPLAKSRTSRNQGVLVLEKLSLETSFSKNRVLCQRAIRCTSTWRYRIGIFQSTRERDCKFPKTRFAKNISAICEFRFRHLQNQKTNIRKYVITPSAKFENSRLKMLVAFFFEFTEQNEAPCCHGS